jgi:hypothetical protein
MKKAPALMSINTVHGLPWFAPREKKTFDKQGFSALYAVGPLAGRPVYIGHTRKFPERMTNLKSEFKGDFAVHSVVWTEGDLLARRIMAEAEAILDKAKRRLRSNLFDIPSDMAQQVVRIAAQKSGVRVLSHDQMLKKVRAIRESMIDAAVKEYSTVERFDWQGFEEGVKIDEGRAELDLAISGRS